MNINFIGTYTLIQSEAQRFLRTVIQSLVGPWVNALLYIFIFGYVVGFKINFIPGFRYIEFVLPGILMLNVITAAFLQTSFSIFHRRFSGHIEEILIAPLSTYEIIFGYVVGAVLRSICVGIGIYIIAICFQIASIEHIGSFFFYIISVSIIFAFLGIVTGLWSETFEQLAVFQTFVITPLTFLGGIFNSIDMLPENIQTILRFNPFFYFVDGLRYAMIGYQESTLFLRSLVIAILILLSASWAVLLLARGYKIKT